MLHSFYFSATGTTERVVDAFAASFGQDHMAHDLTLREPDTLLQPDDVALFAAPVYGGRLPGLAADRFRSVRGAGQKCIAVVVYGNRDYDDALAELCDLLTECGFVVVAAGAFVARHCIFPSVASDRPDSGDLEQITAFAARSHSAVAQGRVLDLSSVKGNRPYKKFSVVPLHPKVDKALCHRCGICARECPAGAITVGDLCLTDETRCISCARCVTVCPDGARRFRGLMYSGVAPLFKKKCAARREPECFVAGESI